MMRKTRKSGWGNRLPGQPARVAGTLLLALLAGVPWTTVHAADKTLVGAQMGCSGVAALALPDTRIVTATEQAGPVAHCHVVGVIDERVSHQDPDHFTYGIGFEINLPDRWNGQFELMGGGGTDGSMKNPIGAAGTELGQHWVVADDDGGHEDHPDNPLGYSDDDPSAGGSAHFGVDEQARIDYGYNGIIQTTRITKRIIAAFYGSGPRYSYLWGCSNGGRDGLVASQRIPDAFNGIVAGNPGLDLPAAGVAEAWNEQQLAPLATSTDANGQPYLPPTFPPQDLKVASAAILSACDGLDGLVDGIINDYSGCTNRLVYKALSAFTCSRNGAHGDTPHGGQCLTPGQVAALKRIYAGPHNSRGQQLYSRWYWDAGIWDPKPAAGWRAWNVALYPWPGHNTALNLTLGAGAIPMVFTTPPVVTPVSSQEAFIFNYSFDTDAPKIFTTAPGYPQSAMDFMTAIQYRDGHRIDLQPFAHDGGKMIIYDSVNDGIFSAVHLVHWYRSIDGADGGRARRFVRLFLVPNMAHCGGGPATDHFSANMLSAITAWVKHGKAPNRIVAANTDQTPPFPAGAPFDPRVAKNFPTDGTRPLCAYPKQARYKGSGPTNVAASFVCVTPGPGRSYENQHRDQDR